MTRRRSTATAAVRLGGSTATRAAQAVSELLAPTYVAVAMQLVVGVLSTPRSLEGAGWGVLSALVVVALPEAYVRRGVRRGRFTDRHIRVREQRAPAQLFAAGCAVAGVGLLLAAGAPRQLTALLVATLAGVVITGAVTLAWKISIHVASVAGAVTVLVMVLGPWSLAAAPAVVAVGWARVRLRLHTPGQVVAGAAADAVVAGVVFGALR